MKIRVVACVVAGVMSLLCLTFGVDAFQKSSYDYDERINTLESANDRLVVKIEDKVEEISRLRASIDATNKELKDLQLEIKEVKTSFSIVYGALTFLSGLIAIQVAQRLLGRKEDNNTST